jgi:hypothetical protein
MKSKKEELDYLLIPTGWEKQREKRVFEEISRRKIKHFLILAGCNSSEDILYLGKKLKGKERLGFVTFPLHYQKYKDLIKKAQKEKKFPKEIYIENIKTGQTPRQFIYGILALIEEKLTKGIDYKNNNPSLINRLKKIIKNILH